MGAQSSCDCFGAGPSSTGSMQKSGLNGKVELGKLNPQDPTSKQPKYQQLDGENDTQDTPNKQQRPNNLQTTPAKSKPKAKGQRKLELQDFIMLRVNSIGCSSKRL